MGFELIFHLDVEFFQVGTGFRSPCLQGLFSFSLWFKKTNTDFCILIFFLLADASVLHGRLGERRCS